MFKSIYKYDFYNLIFKFLRCVIFNMLIILYFNIIYKMFVRVVGILEFFGLGI